MSPFHFCVHLHADCSSLMVAACFEAHSFVNRFWVKGNGSVLASVNNTFDSSTEAVQSTAAPVPNEWQFHSPEIGHWAFGICKMHCSVVVQNMNIRCGYLCYSHASSISVWMLVALLGQIIL